MSALETPSDERAQRLAKLDALRERGIEPYPAALRRATTPRRTCTAASPGSTPDAARARACASPAA